MTRYHPYALCCGFGPVKTVKYKAFVDGNEATWLPGEILHFENRPIAGMAYRTCSFCNAEWEEPRRVYQLADGFFLLERDAQNDGKVKL